MHGIDRGRVQRIAGWQFNAPLAVQGLAERIYYAPKNVIAYRNIQRTASGTDHAATGNSIRASVRHDQHMLPAEANHFAGHDGASSARHDFAQLTNVRIRSLGFDDQAIEGHHVTLTAVHCYLFDL
ncbi:MAG: hypothetical protein BGP18_16350 [Stenotrophomonas sp. 69-14]|nr:MAG: hypothetical protein BGP18_16350 [Stenotrophomonas sp. 69-14]